MLDKHIAIDQRDFPRKRSSQFNSNRHRSRRLAFRTSPPDSTAGESRNESIKDADKAARIRPRDYGSGESNHHIPKEFFFLDLCPPVTTVPTSVALIARSEEGLVTVARLDEIQTFVEGIDLEERAIALEQLGTLPTIFELDPCETFDLISESFSGTLRVRQEEENAVVGGEATICELLSQLNGRFSLYRFRSNGSLTAQTRD